MMSIPPPAAATAAPLSVVVVVVVVDDVDDISIHCNLPNVNSDGPLFLFSSEIGGGSTCPMRSKAMPICALMVSPHAITSPIM